jgi:hypothetical protein
MTKFTVSREIHASPEKTSNFVISERMNEVWGEWMIGKWIQKSRLELALLGTLIQGVC